MGSPALALGVCEGSMCMWVCRVGVCLCKHVPVSAYTRACAWASMSLCLDKCVLGVFNCPFSHPDVVAPVFFSLFLPSGGAKVLIWKSMLFQFDGFCRWEGLFGARPCHCRSLVDSRVLSCSLMDDVILQYIDYVGSWGPAIVGHAQPMYCNFQW
jgi:hypothetical protein